MMCSLRRSRERSQAIHRLEQGGVRLPRVSCKEVRYRGEILTRHTYPVLKRELISVGFYSSGSQDPVSSTKSCSRTTLRKSPALSSPSIHIHPLSSYASPITSLLLKVLVSSCLEPIPTLPTPAVSVCSPSESEELMQLTLSPTPLGSSRPPTSLELS
jgi:hypothetical protein